MNISSKQYPTVNKILQSVNTLNLPFCFDWSSYLQTRVYVTFNRDLCVNFNFSKEYSSSVLDDAWSALIEYNIKESTLNSIAKEISTLATELTNTEHDLLNSYFFFRDISGKFYCSCVDEFTYHVQPIQVHKSTFYFGEKQ